MGRTAIPGHDESEMRRAGKKDGRLWRWTIMPWFIVAKEPLPEPGKPARKINEVAEAAEEVIAGILKTWNVADGGQQKIAAKAANNLRRFQGSPDQSLAAHISKNSNSYEEARIERRTRWKVAVAGVNEVEQRYSELAQAYVYANHAARRNAKVEIAVPALTVPPELEENGLKPLEIVLGLTAEDLKLMGLRPDAETAAGGQAA